MSLSRQFSSLVFVVCAVVVGVFVPTLARAQDSQILSVTPPLFQLSIQPGDIWQSTLKVVNGNPYELTVYAEVVNFSATGEGGQGRFVPLLDEEEGESTLAQWIEIAEGPHVIAPEQTKDVSFFVDVPQDAAPGGHYAAILISTEPQRGEDSPLAVQTSQAVTSLFFIKIEGEVEERGLIREFSAVDSFLETPSVELSLRFENKGNVHLQPRGDIIITNMWGTERGRIPVNYQTHFGNVLPNSIRDFRFEWESDFKITDIGRYTAAATLTYGSEGFQSESAETHFWIIPVKATLITLAVLILFVTLIVFMVRAYIRKMLTLAGVNPDEVKQQDMNERESEISMPRRVSVSEPLKSGVLDLRKQLQNVEESVDVLRTIVKFVGTYKKFFISLVVLITIFVTSVLYISRATEEGREYTVTVEQGEVVLPSNE